MIEYNTLVVLAGVGLLGAAAGLIGTFAVLRRFALVGDALAHAALPGLCLAFLVVGERNLPAMLAGAFLSGLAGIVVLAFLRRWTRVKEDAAVGIVLSVFFGAGVVLVKMIQNRNTEGSKAGLDSYILGKTAGILLQDVYFTGGLALVCLVAVLALYKEFQVAGFDPGFARVQGWPTLALDLGLMGLIAVAVVIGLPAVGVVLMAALLILPGAAARFWTDRLGTMLVLSSLVGLATGLLGTLLSARYSRMPAGAVITLVGTGFFAVSAFFAPRRGIVGRWLAQRRFRQDADEAALLRLLFELSETLPRVPPGAILARKAWRPGYLDRLARDAAGRGELLSSDGSYQLTPAGLPRAAELARQERLWRLFLTEYPDLSGQVRPLDGTPIEDVLPAPLVAELAARLDQGVKRS